MARRFRFRLQTLLKVRQLREREAKRKVGAKRAEIARLAGLIAQTAAEITGQQAALLTLQQVERLDPLALQRGRAWVAYLRRTLAAQQMQRAELIAQLKQLQAAWHGARTQMRVIEKLRERRWSEYVHARARHEQATADELAQQLLADDRS